MEAEFRAPAGETTGLILRLVSWGIGIRVHYYYYKKSLVNTRHPTSTKGVVSSESSSCRYTSVISLTTLAIELEPHDLPPLSNLPNLSAPYFIFPLNLRSSGRGRVDNESAPSEMGGKGEMTSAFGVGFEFKRRKGFAEAVL
jgi:hypothetical protein